MKKRHFFEILGIIFVIGLILFGLHLDRSYRSLVASTANAPALLEQAVLDEYGERLATELRAQDVKLAIVSRAGQARSQMPEGISYTHSAFFVRNDDGEYSVFNLYHGDVDRNSSSLVQDSPTDFLRPTRAHDLGIIIPTEAFQHKMRAHILSENYGRMHTNKYSLISNPFDLRYQNCNEFMLDELASTYWDLDDRGAVKAKLEGIMNPTEIKAGLVRRYIAPFIDERLVMEDHGDQILTTTRNDLNAFLENSNALQESYVLYLNPDLEP